jgi:hypothetical protein
MKLMTEKSMKKSEVLTKHIGLKKRYEKYYTHMLTFYLKQYFYMAHIRKTKENLISELIQSDTRGMVNFATSDFYLQ